MDWDFYYDNGNATKKASIQSQIEAMNSYLFESTFDDFFEKSGKTSVLISLMLYIKVHQLTSD